MTITFELEPEIEDRLSEAAALQGQEPSAYAKAIVEMTLAGGPRPLAKGVPLEKLLEGLIGSVHSREGEETITYSKATGMDMAEDLIEKRRQGHL